MRRFCNRYCMIRSKEAGVFAGTLDALDIATGTAVVTNARRIFWLEGAASLSQLATTGTSSPTACKFTAPVKEVLLLNVIEIITITDEAARSIASVEEWGGMSVGYGDGSGYGSDYGSDYGSVDGYGDG